MREGALPLLGGAALVIVVSQLINHPPAAQGAALQSGAWLALGGAGAMAAGGLLGVTRISLSLSLSSRSPERERRPRERRPAPEPGSAPPRAGRLSPANEAAAVEPEVHHELYPTEERSGPIGADDPELWRAPAEEEPRPFDAESE